MTSTKIIQLGEKAMQYIADAPLYASTCGITYQEAIRVARALNPAWEAELLELERFNNLSLDEQKAEMDKYNAEMQKVRATV